MIDTFHDDGMDSTLEDVDEKKKFFMRYTPTMPVTVIDVLKMRKGAEKCVMEGIRIHHVDKQYNYVWQYEDTVDTLPLTQLSHGKKGIERYYTKPLLNVEPAIASLKTAHINRRVTWLKYATKEGKNASYVTAEGTVVLIGDAAHGMTPSLGEGCNTALESAVRLVEVVVSEMINDGDENKSRATPTSRHLTAAFVKYGLSRPKDVIPIQEMSASRGRLSNFTKNDIKKASET